VVRFLPAQAAMQVEAPCIPCVRRIPPRSALYITASAKLAIALDSPGSHILFGHQHHPEHWS